MIVEDFVMLGTTVPEPSSKYGLSVCSAGWSSELRQLIRIYPLARGNAPRRWSINRVRLERSRHDSRPESWCIAGDRTPQGHPSINDAFTCVGQVEPASRRSLLEAAFASSIAEADERRSSLAIIHPMSTPKLAFDHNPNSPDSPELRLFDLGADNLEGSKRFPFTPRLEFSDANGTHRLQLRDWGAFEFMRKYGESRRYDLASALHLSEQSSLLVGNHNHHRNAWLVIAVLGGLRTNQLSLLPELKVAS
jgi:hypothetical protein